MQNDEAASGFRRARAASRNLGGKEGVGGSSPSEGVPKSPANGICVLLPGTTGHLPEAEGLDVVAVA